MTEYDADGSGTLDVCASLFLDMPRVHLPCLLTMAMLWQWLEFAKLFSENMATFQVLEHTAHTSPTPPRKPPPYAALAPSALTPN